MIDHRNGRNKKKNRAVTQSVLCSVLASVLFAASCSAGPSGSAGSGEQEIKIGITAPSAIERTIAPGRHFKAAGVLDGDVPDDAVLKVALLDEAGKEVRFAASPQKGTDRVVTGSVGGEITDFEGETGFSEIAYTAPELVVADTEDPGASAHDATVKFVYTDTTFYALIVSATDTAHGLAEPDGYELTDHEGKPYDALPEGKYTVQVTLSSADGKELASASEEIAIGWTNGTVIHEMTNMNVFQKGGKDLLISWAQEEDLTVIDDLLPGFFDPFYQMSTMPMSVCCETAEYLPGTIHMLVYGNSSGSASYALEVAKYLQLEHRTEDPAFAKYYMFDLGEPSFAGKQAVITAFGEDENIHICRIDHVREETQDGVFLNTEEHVLGSDTDPSDGWTVPEGTFAVAGVMKPYQLQDDELVPDEEVCGFYTFSNGADSLIYTFVPSDGSEPFTITKAAGVSRIDTPDEQQDPALYEFYNVFPEDTLQAGLSYEVTVQAYDRNGMAVPDAVCVFTLER
ncbi:MAG: hypothetical protein K6G61_00975 [Solobacterium sp.]|nr:hypothetical protein [Solobacterium sp.]